MNILDKTIMHELNEGRKYFKVNKNILYFKIKEKEKSVLKYSRALVNKKKDR